MDTLLIHDPTLRDGNHAVKHKITLDQIRTYCSLMDSSGIDYIEVGHGLGLGASSLQLGLCDFSDKEILETARKEISHAKLAGHITPGYGREKDLKMAVEIGIESLRVAAHCSEANLTQRLIETAAQLDIPVYGSLTMSHMLEPELLVEQALLIESYGACGVVIMDSAGAFLPKDVAFLVGLLKKSLKGVIGFHGHNNLGLAVANSLVAVEYGADIIDGTALGFGAGAGNTSLEIVVAALIKSGFTLNVDLKKLLNAIDYIIENKLIKASQIRPNNIMTGVCGIFGGFERQISRVAHELGVDSKDIITQLGMEKVVAGQEDKILEVAYKLKGELEI